MLISATKIISLPTLRMLPLIGTITLACASSDIMAGKSITDATAIPSKQATCN